MLDYLALKKINWSKQQWKREVNLIDLNTKEK